MTVKCLSVDDKKRVARSYLAGMTQDTCAAIWCVSRRTIQRVLIEQNILPPEGSRISVTPTEKEMLAFIRQHNLTLDHLNTLTSFKPLTTRNVVKALGALDEDPFNEILGVVNQLREQRGGMNATIN